MIHKVCTYNINKQNQMQLGSVICVGTLNKCLKAANRVKDDTVIIKVKNEEIHSYIDHSND